MGRAGAGGGGHRSLGMAPDGIGAPRLRGGRLLWGQSQPLVEVPSYMRREELAHVPTSNTSRSAGALVSLSTWNRDMPDTIGLTKYTSKMENMDAIWKIIAMARNLARDDAAMLAECGQTR